MTNKLVKLVAKTIADHENNSGDPWPNDWWDSWVGEAEAVIARLDGSNGWQLVPVEPTEEQISTAGEPYNLIARAIYKAILAAAPDPLAEDKP